MYRPTSMIIIIIIHVYTYLFPFLKNVKSEDDLLKILYLV